MKIGLVVTALLSISTLATATPLKLSPDIDLLAVDGKKMTGSLLKGADSLELDGGQHQLLFKVNKSIRSDQQEQVPYVSLPIIATFNTQNISTVAIELPHIENDRDAQRFDSTLNYQVIDAKGSNLPIRHDVLHSAKVSSSTDLEKVMSDYNRQDRPASVPAFAQALTATPGIPLVSVPLNSPIVTPNSKNASEQMLQYWFQQANKEIQQRFLRWGNKQPIKGDRT